MRYAAVVYELLHAALGLKSRDAHRFVSAETEAYKRATAAQAASDTAIAASLVHDSEPLAPQPLDFVGMLATRFSHAVSTLYEIFHPTPPLLTIHASPLQPYKRRSAPARGDVPLQRRRSLSTAQPPPWTLSAFRYA